MPQRYIVMQCYGNESIFYECAYSLLTLSRLYEGELQALPEIWIYTDKPEWIGRFKECKLPLRFERLDPATLEKWRGSIQFVHRVKIELLLHFTHNRQGSILYLDTDMVFTHRLEPLWAMIGSGELCMHLQEGRIADKTNRIFTKLDKYLNTSANPMVAGKKLQDLHMWNAGLLGFDASYRHVLNDVLAFTDGVFPDFPKHVVEQFAFSVFFQQNGQVKAGLPWFLHFWNMKEVRPLLESFFKHFEANTWGELTRLAGGLQLYDLALQKIWFERNRSFVDKLTNKKWQAPQMDWERYRAQL